MSLRPPSRRRRRGSLAGALVAATLAAGCGADTPGLVIVISLDTFRADALGGGETPFLDRLAADSAAFEAAYIPLPHTLPSHMSLVTGLYPDVHGVRHTEPDTRLREGIPTLGTLMQDAGYLTAGAVTSTWLKPEFGFARGFDSYEVNPLALTYAGWVHERAARQHARTQDGRPLFLFLHFYDAHSDFLGPDRLNLPYWAPADYRRDLELRAEDFCYGTACSTNFLGQTDLEGVAVRPEVVATVEALYRAGVRYLDAELGRFFADLERRGLYDGALIVVVADHGEEFREHGRFLHSQPYDETSRIPLLIKFPGRRHAGARIARPVEILDVLPTLLDALGLPAPEHLQGESLLPLLAGDGPAGAGDALLQNSMEADLSEYGLRAGRYKLIADRERGRRRLYDLANDPAETRDVLALHRDLAARLERRLDARLAANRRLAAALAAGERAEGGLLTEEERRALEALGYLQ